MDGAHVDEAFTSWREAGEDSRAVTNAFQSLGARAEFGE